MHYYKKNIGDYRRRAHSLTILEHGVYSQLLDEYYLNEKPLPKNIEEVCDEIGARSEEEIAAVHKILKKFFSLTKKGFQQTHCDEVISAYQANSLINKENGKKGGRPKGKTKRVNSDNPNESESKGNQEPLTTNHKPQDQKTRRTFVPPSITEVSDYISEKGYSIDPETFIDHYQANGWMRGKSKIKDWKACVRTWSKNGSNGNGNGKTQQPSKHEQALNRTSEALRQAIEEEGLDSSVIQEI